MDRYKVCPSCGVQISLHLKARTRKECKAEYEFCDKCKKAMTSTLPKVKKGV